MELLWRKDFNGRDQTAFDLPEDNKAAVYERMISERNQIAASYQGRR